MLYYFLMSNTESYLGKDILSPNPLALEGVYIAAEKIVHALPQKSSFSNEAIRSFETLYDVLVASVYDPSIFDNPQLSVSRDGNTKLEFPIPDHTDKRLAITLRPDGLTISLEGQDQNNPEEYLGDAAIRFSEKQSREGVPYVSSEALKRSSHAVIPTGVTVASLDEAKAFFRPIIERAA